MIKLSHNKIFVIAEAGVNHNGQLKLAKRLVDASKNAGADAVKFQAFQAHKLVSQRAPKAGYQKKTTARNESQYEMIKRLELNFAHHLELIDYCRKKEILFMSTPFDEGSADLLEQLKLKIFKIPSGEITNHPFLAHVARKRKPIFLSTGMSTLAEVKDAVAVINKAGNKQVYLLHCITEYPAPYDQLNLKAILTLQKEMKLPVGFSDHSPGITMAIAAAGMGAVIIEKHLTLDRRMPGPDHKASLEPNEFIQLVGSIRLVEKALGDGIKRPSACEQKYIKLVRKSVVAQRNILKGTRISKLDIALKRPADGIQPKDFYKVIGKKAKQNIKAEETIHWNQLT